MGNKTTMRTGTVLRSIYRIEKQLAAGGFGNTYMATNIEFGEHVAIKEFFMKGVTERDMTTNSVSVSNITNYDIFIQQREKFKKEARRLRKLRNQHIIAVHDLFEENSTAYYVMDYIDGENLAERMKQTRMPLSEDEVWQLLPQILDALKCVHDAGIWHLDIKPGNIMLDKKGNATLIDFGASKQMDAQTGGATAKTAISFTNGYAPREQMEKNYSKMGPWTDIYALGATLYALLTNKRPPLPSDIDDDESPNKHEALPFPESVSEEMRSLVLMMMNTNRTKRPQSVEALLDYLDLNKAREESSQDTETKQEEKDVDEETCLNNGSKAETYEADNEETVFTSGNSKAEANEAPSSDTHQDDQQPEYQSLYQDIEDEGSHTSWLKKLLLFVSVFLISYFLFSTIGETTSNDGSTFGIDSLEAVDTTLIDTTASVVEMDVPLQKNAMTCTVGNLGECSYSGGIDDAGKPHGEGEAKFADGRYYKGAFNHGKLTGKVKGFFRYQNGDTFQGEFEDNRFYYGTYTQASDGSYFEGYFNGDGQPKQGKWYDNNGAFLEAVG